MVHAPRSSLLTAASFTTRVLRKAGAATTPGRYARSWSSLPGSRLGGEGNRRVEQRHPRTVAALYERAWRLRCSHFSGKPEDAFACLSSRPRTYIRSASSRLAGDGGSTYIAAEAASRRSSWKRGPAGGWDQVGGRVSSRRETERRRTCCARRPPDRSSPHRLDLILRTHYSVPLLVDRLYKRGRQPGSPRPRAGSSNPSLSSGESVANSVFAKARRRAPPSPCRCPNLGRSTSPLNKPLHAGRTPGRSQNVLFE